jgi:hypothetical protein
MVNQPVRLTGDLGPIPDGWEVIRFDEAFSIEQGKQVSSKTRGGSNQRPFLRTKNVISSFVKGAMSDVRRSGKVNLRAATTRITCIERVGNVTTLTRSSSSTGCGTRSRSGRSISVVAT